MTSWGSLTIANIRQLQSVYVRQYVLNQLVWWRRNKCEESATCRYRLTVSHSKTHAASKPEDYLWFRNDTLLSTSPPDKNGGNADRLWLFFTGYLHSSQGQCNKARRPFSHRVQVWKQISKIQLATTTISSHFRKTHCHGVCANMMTMPSNPLVSPFAHKTDNKQYLLQWHRERTAHTKKARRSQIAHTSVSNSSISVCSLVWTETITFIIYIFAAYSSPQSRYYVMEVQRKVHYSFFESWAGDQLPFSVIPAAGNQRIVYSKNKDGGSGTLNKR